MSALTNNGPFFLPASVSRACTTAAVCGNRAADWVALAPAAGGVLLLLLLLLSSLLLSLSILLGEEVWLVKLYKNLRTLQYELNSVPS